jgi:diphthamide biosynthesis methyltransferase
MLVASPYFNIEKCIGLKANYEIVDKHYTHIGEEAQEKAIHSLFGTANTVSDREKIEKALAVIDSLSDKNETILQIESILRDG